ncbi:MAG TPA: tetratricopeptide repeat protein [Burkholderiales bacterium]|jgi:tetratricopeptide (TPR) repeat protein|nr:tetratricopeptide repeat protein [Burkholderiales bacterium]
MNFLRISVQCLLALALTLPAVLRADDYQEAARLFKQGRHAAALEKVDAVLSANPKDARARFLKGLIYTEQDKPQEAIRIFSALTEDYPELPEPYNNLAVLYAAQGQYEQARKALEMAIRTHPSYAIAHENLGDVYAKMASEAYDKALQLDRGNKTAQSKLSLIRELFSSSAPARPSSAVPSAETVAVKPSAPAASPLPAAAAPQSSKTRPDPAQEVLEAVHGWARAWESKDVERYLGHYSPDFATPGGQPWGAWAAARRERLKKPKAIQVVVGAPKVSFENEARAVVRFKQTYKSDMLHSTGEKKLTLVKSSDRWLIVQEQIDR